MQTDDYVMMNVEWMHDTRIIPIGGELDPEAPPRWNGHSVAHWEGDELVVTTTNFLESTGDARTAKDLKVVERFSRIDGDNLRYSFTVHDPNYARSWSGEYPWPATEHKLYEYACHEGNYSFGGIMKGARTLEPGPAEVGHRRSCPPRSGCAEDGEQHRVGLGVALAGGRGAHRDLSVLG